MEGEELPLSIPVKVLWDHLSCPICMSVLHDTHMTPCGHRYCKACIVECVNRRHKCPCCNADVMNVREVIRDHQFDVLIQNIRAEKEMAEKTYFEDLINAAMNSASTSEANNTSLSPVEEILKKHLRDGLVAHENYYQNLRNQCNHQLQLISRELTRSMDELQKDTLQADFQVKLADLKSMHENQKQSLLGELQNCGQMLSEAYDRYLSEHLPAPSLLPVNVSLVLLNKEITFSDVKLKPNDSISQIQEMLKSKMDAIEDPIVAFTDDVRFLLVGPFAKRSLYETHQLARDIVYHGAVHPNVVLLPADCCPVLQFGAKPGSEIIIVGQVKCKSDLPKICFATTFEPGTGQSIDYFSCRDCGFNWVCKSCKESCHKEHHTVPYILNHQPSWACCYCPKKRKCIL